MNSRDRAYEDEQLLRAIEASKEDAPHDAPEALTRRAKRGRSDSEDHTNVKRQRTSSRSASPPAQPVEATSREESDEESSTRSGAKKARNNKTQKAKTEKEDKERQRQEAADKRKGRAERRRGEDSDPSEETPVAPVKPPAAKSIETPIVTETPAPVQPAPDTPPTSHPPATNTHKRGGRNTHKKGKGRNQYTRDRDADGESPARSMSRDIQKNGDESTPGHSKSTNEHHRHGKSKAAPHHKLSMMDMKRRVGAIMDFISRTQVDLAAEALPVPNGATSSGRVSPQKTPIPQSVSRPESQSTAVENGSTRESSHDKDFKDLNCMEMMDVLTRDMVKWQSQYT
ncbi:hypothetical protein CEP51_015463 [Fusarium floridanum]|nr:hypothetical protein CEP51_015463 [Fusarium floridanum]